jgi:hypothetical protein
MRLLWLAVDNTLAQLFYSRGYARIFTEKSRSSIVAEYVQLAMSRLHAARSMHHLSSIECLSFGPEQPVESSPVKPSAATQTTLQNSQLIALQLTLY